MATDTITIAGRAYISHDCWTFGDCGGAGSSGKANIRYLSEQCENHIIECPMSDLRYAAEGTPYGLGADTLAEIKAERPWMIIAYGDYGSEQAWIRKPLAMRTSSHGWRGQTWLERMESYPLFDDEIASEIEMDWEMEAWNDWLRSDLIRTMDDDGSREEAEAMGNDALMTAYWNAKETTNTECVAEYNGVHVDVGRMASAFADEITAAIELLYTP